MLLDRLRKRLQRLPVRSIATPTLRTAKPSSCQIKTQALLLR
jgi:hypothetical protein